MYIYIHIHIYIYIRAGRRMKETGVCVRCVYDNYENGNLYIHIKS